MRHSIISILSILACASFAFDLNAVIEQPTKTFGFPFFKQRPQILNTPRRIAGELDHFYKPELKYLNGSFSLIPEYTRSFDSTALGEYLFFNGKNTMRFGPAGAPGVDVAAREFLMGEGFISDVTAKPRVQNFLVEFTLRLGLDEWIPNTYFDLRAPVVWTKWDINLKENIINQGTGQIAQGEIGNNTSTITAPYKSIIQSWNGQRTVADVIDTMTFARVDGGQTKIQLADMEFVIGYNIVNKDWVHFGANIRAIAATSNNAEAIYLFEPLAGGAHHSAIGGGIDGHFKIYNPTKTQSFGFYYFGNVYHMFAVEQPRTFDLKVNGPGSRYLLFKQFDDLNIFTQIITRGPNILTFPVKVKIAVEAEATFVFNYKRCNLSVDFGYNVWGRTREDITLETGFPEEAPHFGVKGNTNTIDPTLVPPNLPPGTPEWSEFTASKATIKGTNAQPDIDPLTGQMTRVYVTTKDLDIKGAEARGTLSHKIFAHVGYEWPSCDVSPFIGLGGEGEFSGQSNTALNQWGLWIKGGIYFE